MRNAIAVVIYSVCFGAAIANPLPKPAAPAGSQSQDQHQAQSQAAYGGGGGTGQGGAGGSNQWSDNSRFYAFPGFVFGGPPLPGGLCPMNDRAAWGIGWNFFWIDTSTVRTDMQCLEAMLGVMRMTAQKPVLLPPLKRCETLHPPKKHDKPKPGCKRVT